MHAEGPVFIVGVNGSGITMLADSLGKHPDLFMFPRETRVLPYLAQQFFDGELASLAQRRSLAEALVRSKAFYRSNGDRMVDLDTVDLAACHDFPSAVGAGSRSRVGRYGAGRNPSNWAVHRGRPWGAVGTLKFPMRRCRAPRKAGCSVSASLSTCLTPRQSCSRPCVTWTTPPARLLRDG